MDKFLNLDKTKRDNIINSALFSFGNNGYKKASMNDIALEAGISKSLVFHYFESKKKLYLFLFDYCTNLITTEMDLKLDQNETDFFEKIKLSENIKISVIARYPSMFIFLKSAYFESDKEVSNDIKIIHQKYLSGGLDIFSQNTNFTKFKDGVDAQMILKIISWCAEGFIDSLPKVNEMNISTICEEFDQYLILFKNNFYKEEYLS